MTAAEKILQKRLVTSGLSSADWDRVSAGLKDRAFWSARVQSVRYLQTAQSTLGDLLSGANNADGALTSRAQIVSDLMRTAREEGIAKGTGGLTDPGSAKRAAVIVDTNAGLARGYTNFVASNTLGGRTAFPAWELVRVEPRQATRDWRSRWQAAGGTLPGGRMIALTDDPVWAAISAFGTPWPPFDYGSGMGVADISFETCVALGILPPDWLPAPNSDPVADFNGKLDESITFQGPSDPSWMWLKEQFGDQVKYAEGKIAWQSDLIMDRLSQYAADPTFRQVTRLSVATPDAIAKAKGVADLTGKQLSAPAETLGHIKDRHFGTAETDPRNVPLTESDISLLPHVWRNPDHVTPDGAALNYWKKMADGNWLKMIVDQFSGGLHLKTMYKVKAGASGLPFGL